MPDRPPLDLGGNPDASGSSITLVTSPVSGHRSAAGDLDALIANLTTVRTARAWVYKEQLRDILERKQINVVRAMLQHWCTCVMRSKVEPMKEVAAPGAQAPGGPGRLDFRTINPQTA